MKNTVLLLACYFCLMSNLASAAEISSTEPTEKSGVNWEISMQPKPTAEEVEAARWSVILENNIGIYAYDMNSFTYTQVKNGIPNKNIIGVLTKTQFTDVKLIKRLNDKYKAKLAKEETVSNCQIFMEFDLPNKAYRVITMDVFGNKKSLLDHQVKNAEFLSVPTGSFAEALLEICQQTANEDLSTGQ